MILTLVCIYGPNRDDPHFFSTFNDILNDFQCDKIIWAGDFNFVFNLDLDKVGGILRTNFNARDDCISIMQSHDLVDIWRERNPTTNYFLGLQILPPVFTAGLIFFLISQTMSSYVIESRFKPAIQSDHCFVTLSIQLLTDKRGPGFWKFNNSLLLDNVFVERIIALINEEKSNTFPDAREYKVRTLCIRYSKEKAYERRKNEFLILNAISKLEHSLFNHESPDIRNRLKDRRNDLLLLYHYRLEGHVLDGASTVKKILITFLISKRETSHSILFTKWLMIMVNLVLTIRIS